MIQYRGFWGVVKLIYRFIRHPNQWRNLVGQIKDRKDISRRILSDEPYDDLIGDENTDYNRALRDCAKMLKEKKENGELIELN